MQNEANCFNGIAFVRKITKRADVAEGQGGMGREFTGYRLDAEARRQREARPEGDEGSEGAEMPRLRMRGYTSQYAAILGHDPSRY
jgi:hypothetical protein